MTDPIADMLTRIRNALLIKKDKVSLPYSQIKFEIAKILEKEGRIDKVEVAKKSLKKDLFAGDFKQLELTMKYDNGQPVITSIKRISKPGCRIYVKKDRIPRVLNGLGMVILSTSRGLMAGQEARKQGLGGELICEIW